MHTDVREYINLCRVKKGNISEAELARRTGQTPQNMNNKYKRNTFKIAELEKEGKALVLRPHKDLGVTRYTTDPEKLGPWFQLGYDETLERIDQIKEFIK